MKKESEHIVLKATDLSVGYQTKKQTHTVAKHINFELKKGELVGLIGANGIGKSTLLRTLTKTQQSLAGTIHINNQELTQIDLINPNTASNIDNPRTFVLAAPIGNGNGFTINELLNMD